MSQHDLTTDTTTLTDDQKRAERRFAARVLKGAKA